MEQLIELILAGLRAAGFRAEWAGPGKLMPRIASPVLAVSMPKMEFVKSPNANNAGAAAELRVRVFSPTALGAAKCQETAQNVAIALTQGVQNLPPLSCRVEEAAYYGKGDYFTADVFGSFGVESDENGAMLPVGELTLETNQVSQGRFNLIRVKEQREIRPVYAMGEQGTALSAMGRVQYELTVRRHFPAKKWDNTYIAGLKDFEVKLLRGNRIYQYYHCQWLSCTWEDTPTGSDFTGVIRSGSRSALALGGGIHGKNAV